MKKLGNFGERLVEKYFFKKRYKKIDKNFFTPYGEIDLIFETQKEIIFIEVKTRKKRPKEITELIGYKKRKCLYKSIQYYLSLNETEKEIRFDFILVLMRLKKTKLFHYKEVELIDE